MNQREQLFQGAEIAQHVRGQDQWPGPPIAMQKVHHVGLVQFGVKLLS